MGRASTAAINYELTNFAAGKFNEMQAQDAQKLSMRLAPIVTVPGATGQYKSFDDINAFQIYDTARAIGGDPVRMEFKATDPTYSCLPRALEITIDEHERDQVGDSPLGNQLLTEGKIAAVTSAAARADANEVVTAVLAAVTATPARGNWSSAAIDPIDQLDEALDTLSLAVGTTGNINIDMDVTAWRTLRNHPKTKLRTNPNQVTPITLDQLNSNLLFPVSLNVANIVKHTTNVGQSTQTKARILSGEVLIYLSIQNPGVFDPSAFKRFTVGMGGSPVGSVRSWNSPNGLYEGHFLDWTRDLKQTGTTAMIRFTMS